MSGELDPSEVLPYDPIDHLRTDAVEFVQLVTDHGFDHDVPSCPGWRLGDLTWHIGEVWNFWSRIVAERVTSVDTVQTWEPPPRPSDEFLLDWAMTAHTALLSALVDAPHDDEVWTWTGANRDVRWVERRMTQETAIHRWDASNAVGVPYDIPVPVAADGIDEHLTWFARAAPDADPVGGTLHLHCTDTAGVAAEDGDDRAVVNGEWFVAELTTDGARFTREHVKGDVAVRGSAQDLLLWLWRRDTGPVEILGDADVAERFRAASALT